MNDIEEFPQTTVVLKFREDTGDGMIDYRHVKTQQQLAAMLGCFAMDLISEGYLAEDDVRAVMNTAILEARKEEKQ
jgi:hypothetical protein